MKSKRANSKQYQRKKSAKKEIDENRKPKCNAKCLLCDSQITESVSLHRHISWMSGAISHIFSERARNMMRFLF